jgi:hypothetical protein
MTATLYATVRALLLAVTLVPTAADLLQSASSVCVHNSAAVVLRWRLRDVKTGRELKQNSAYPVGEVRCLHADALNVSAGSKLLPIVDAVWGMEATATEPVLYDVATVSQITYVCHGVAFDISCKPETRPPLVFNATEDVGKFIGGFAAGLLLELSGFGPCLTNIEKTSKSISSVATFFEKGYNSKNKTHIVSAFEIVGNLLYDFGNAIVTCFTGYGNVVEMLKDLAAWLAGGVLKVIEVVVKTTLHIFHRAVDITSDVKAIASDWKAGDYFSSGKALGNIVGILVESLKAELVSTGKLRLMPPVALQNGLFNASSAIVVV